MQIGQAFGAEGVATVNEDTRDLLAYVELLSTVVAKVQPSRLVVALNHVRHDSFSGLLLGGVSLLLVDGSAFDKGLHLKVKS